LVQWSVSSTLLESPRQLLVPLRSVGVHRKCGAVVPRQNQRRAAVAGRGLRAIPSHRTDDGRLGVRPRQNGSCRCVTDPQTAHSVPRYFCAQVLQPGLIVLRGALDEATQRELFQVICVRSLCAQTAHH
jgi:hypothetical protein